jgi:hypothetical protein
MEYIAFDAHKRYTLASVVRPDGGLVREQRIPHERGALQQFLERCEHGSPVAVEPIGNWYWIQLAFRVRRARRSAVRRGVFGRIVDGLRKVNQRLPAHVPDALILYFARRLFKTRAHQTEASIHPVTLLAGWEALLLWGTRCASGRRSAPRLRGRSLPTASRSNYLEREGAAPRAATC